MGTWLTGSRTFANYATYEMYFKPTNELMLTCERVKEQKMWSDRNVVVFCLRLGKLHANFCALILRLCHKRVVMSFRFIFFLFAVLTSCQ